MRDYLVFYVNGEECRVSGADVFQPLSSYLRYQKGQTGTKIVCEEGDCGACSILLGRADNGKITYKAINSCIQYLYQIDRCHIVSIEGLKNDGELNPVQEAMVKCHGAQCGFCTPGFVVTMCGYFDEQKKADPQSIKDCLTGNLCRCTGYEPIIKAGMNVDPEAIIPLAKLYPAGEMLRCFEQAGKESVQIKSEEQTVFIPANLEDALKFKAANPDAIVVSGGTDLSVIMNKRSYEPSSIMSLCNVEGLDGIKSTNGIVNVGARVTLSQLEEFFKERVPEFHNILWVFGSPQIRNAGTLAGNIANASPIADTPPFLFIMDALLELRSSKGTRQVRINEFYKGYKKFDLQKDELITSIVIPMPKKDELIKLYKVSRRKHLDISTNTAAFRLSMKGNQIENIAIAYGGVAATILRLPKTEEFLTGKELTVSNIEAAAEIAVSEISPIDDVRGSKAFRNQLARNLMMKLYFDLSEGRLAACPQ
ncbi:MAG: xanthine dehydrogenase small subunit [Candidatus Obscuribacterales bacterium]|nr:xanthine dehydrogenase small subunit [Candidatus Obscuribacterales bacterium]